VYAGYVGTLIVAGVSLKRTVPYCCLSFIMLPGAGYFIIIYLFVTAIVLIPSGSSTVQTYTQTVRRIRRMEHTLKKIGKCGTCPVFASYTLAFALQLRKKHRKPSVWVVEKCPNILVAEALISQWQDCYESDNFVFPIPQNVTEKK
jgi:hypothetical protein